MRLTDLYLFECSSGGLYAFSLDKTGSNLPKSACRSGWLLRAQLKPGDLIEHQYAAAIDATAEQGFCMLTEMPSRWLG
jgi:hypothetical protein